MGVAAMLVFDLARLNKLSCPESLKVYMKLFTIDQVAFEMFELSEYRTHGSTVKQ